MASKPFITLSANNRVEGWAIAPLPFEPTGWMLDYRRALRVAIGELPVAAGRTLVGYYGSADARRCDVENLLLYNVGVSAFAHLQVRDVVLVRSTLPPQPPDSTSRMLDHHHHYELADAPPPAPAGPLVARLAPTPLRVPPRVESVWYDIRPSGHVEGGEGADSLLAVDVTVHRPPAASRPALLGMVKVVVDGFISALHTHDGSQLEVLAQRLGARLDVPNEGVAQLLSDNAAGVLGCRRLVWPFRTFVQWNPADDIIGWLRVRAEAASSWQLSATVSRFDPGHRGPPLRDTGRP
jgi:hypothetical protein